MWWIECPAGKRQERRPELLRVETLGSVMLLFCQAAPLRWEDLNLRLDPAEVSEVVIVQAPCELAFPTHTEVLAEYFREP